MHEVSTSAHFLDLSKGLFDPYSLSHLAGRKPEPTFVGGNIAATRLQRLESKPDTFLDGSKVTLQGGSQ